MPAGNPITPAKTVLGKILFWEEQMSSNNRVACGTCHKTELGGGDNRRAPHPGLDGVLGNQDDTIGSPGLPNSRADNTYAPDAAFEERLSDAIRSTAPWTPGEEMGQPVRVRVKLPVQF